MKVRICILLFLSVVAYDQLYAQSKTDIKVIKQLQSDIYFLASDALEGRRTSSEGERKAAEFIEKRYKDLQIEPYKGLYRHPFHFIYGKEISATNQIRIRNMIMKRHEEVFPLPFSANKHVSSEILPDVMEQGSIWLISLYADQDQADNPHFEAEKFMYERAKDAEKQGASGVLFYDSIGSKYEPAFNKHSEYECIGIPVAFLKSNAYKKYIKNSDPSGASPENEKSGIPIDINIQVNKADRTSNNVAAFIDNKARYTVVLGAHYDHLGYGDDGNSLHANAIKDHLVHHGADDNASGTAALMEMAKRIKARKLHHFNYLFVHFSGEELGLYGSKAFVKEEGADSLKTAYMINMDMVGRLNDSTKALTVGGVGTSPAWANVVETLDKDFKLVIDSSGVGPSDHTSFYNAGIPVLFFFTGTHKDYHKPTDKADLINYKGEVDVIKSIEKVVAKIDKNNEKPVFSATKQKSMGKSAFKVTLGIMPDYTFESGGVRIDGVSDNRPAIKAGLKQGDVITSLGEIKISGMQTYMEALGKFAPGDKTNITITRDGKQMTLPIELSK
jgi:aminopeptidase YwaD